MWADTAAAKLLQIRYPIVQGPFGGGLSSVELTAAVSNLGGLGSFGAQSFAPKQITDIATRIRLRTKAPFAMNLWIDNANSAMAEFDTRSFERQVNRLRPYYAARARSSGISGALRPEF